MSNDTHDAYDPYDRLVDVLAERIAWEMDYETLEGLSEDDLRRVAEAALEPLLQIERETGRSVDELLDDEPALREALEAFEPEEALGGGDGATPGGYEIPNGSDDEQGGA